MHYKKVKLTVITINVKHGMLFVLNIVDNIKNYRKEHTCSSYITVVKLKN